VALVVSILALVVSGFSFIDNHVTVMPKLIVSNPGTSKPIAGDPRVPIWVLIVNKGKLDATITKIDAESQSSLLLKDQDDCNKALANMRATTTDNFGTLGELSGGGMALINPYVTLPKSCPEIPQEITVKLAISYHDFLHIPYTEHALLRALREKAPGATPAASK
jgi:hypothetical protein